MNTPAPAHYGLTVFDNCRDNLGQYYSVSWDAFAERLQKNEVRLCKDGKAFAPIRLNGNRLKQNVANISMLVLDLDHGLSLLEALAIWEALQVKFVVYSSYSHQRIVIPKHPVAEDCFRIVVPLTEPIRLDKFYLLRQWASNLMLGNVDPQTNDPSRMYYLPAIASQDAPFFACSYNDNLELLDWRNLNLEQFQEKVTPKIIAPTATQEISSNYAQSALTYEIDSLLATPTGQRNGQLNKSAYCLGQLVASGLITEGLVIEGLARGARAIGLQDHEIFPTIQSGLKSGYSSPRTVPTQSRPTARTFPSKTPWILDSTLEQAWMEFASTSATEVIEESLEVGQPEQAQVIVTDVEAIKTLFCSVPKLKPGILKKFNKEEFLKRILEVQQWIKNNPTVEVAPSLTCSELRIFVDSLISVLEKSLDYDFIAIALYLETTVIGLGVNLKICGTCFCCGYPTPDFVRVEQPDGLCRQCRGDNVKANSLVQVKINKINLAYRIDNNREFSDQFPIWHYEITH